MLFIAIITTGLIIVSCSKKEDKLANVSGTVTYGDNLAADGAVVRISNDLEGTDVINSVIADADGKYLISGLNNGTYYLSANYNTDNVNNLKSTGFNFALEAPVSVSVSGDMTQDLQLVNAAPAGNDTINSFNGTWLFDKPHGGVNWSTAYYGDNAVLTGKFTSYNIDISFTEANPESTIIKAWVQLSTALTGEPGRDHLGGCLNGYLGVATDTLADGTYYVSDPSTDTAYFNSTSVAPYGDGYKATGDFTFRGVTKSIDMYFTYTGQADYSADGDGSAIKGGFSGEFDIMAKSDFGVASTAIADKVHIAVSANYRKN